MISDVDLPIYHAKNDQVRIFEKSKFRGNLAKSSTLEPKLNLLMKSKNQLIKSYQNL